MKLSLFLQQTSALICSLLFGPKRALNFYYFQLLSKLCIAVCLILFLLLPTCSKSKIKYRKSCIMFPLRLKLIFSFVQKAMRWKMLALFTSVFGIFFFLTERLTKKLFDIFTVRNSFAFVSMLSWVDLGENFPPKDLEKYRRRFF